MFLLAITIVNSFYVDLNGFFTSNSKGQNIRTSDEFVVDGCGSGTILDLQTGFCWEKDFGVTTYAWTDAITQCSNLNFASHTDWRLSNLAEFESILDENTRTVPNIFTNIPGSGSFVWTNDEHDATTGVAFKIGNGHTGTSIKTTTYLNLCVRNAYN